MTVTEIEEIFTYHEPHADQSESCRELLEYAKRLAFLIAAKCPSSREKSLAFTSLQQAVMWANAAIAIHDSGE